MSVYMYLVVAALLVKPNDSAKCVAPDEYEVTMKHYHENDYYRFSVSNIINMMAYTSFSIDKNNKSIDGTRVVYDFIRMVKYNITVKGQCTHKSLTDETRDIPDRAVKVNNFPVPLPPDMPEVIEYWSFNWSDRNEIILGVVLIRTNVCALVAKALIDSHHELIPESVTYMKGNYTLSISNKNVFKVPTSCWARND